MRIGAEGGESAAERDDFRQGGGAVGVGEVALFRGVHHITAAPEVMEGVVDGDGADAVLVGEAHGLGHGAVGGGLAELPVRVPDLGGGESRRPFLDLRARHAALRAGAEEMVEMEGLDAVVGADAVARGLGAEARALGGLVGMKAAVLVDGGDQRVVPGFGDDVELLGHGMGRMILCGNQEGWKRQIKFTSDFPSSTFILRSPGRWAFCRRGRG